MIVDVKDASFRMFHGGQFCGWSISAYQQEPVCAITSRTGKAVVRGQETRRLPGKQNKFSLTDLARSRHYWRALADYRMREFPHVRQCC